MKYFFLILILLISQHVFSQEFDKNYFSPPVKIPILLTGNFGELRSNHFHSGIDIKTQGKTGIPVYAVADGQISRINISPSGFGLALYIDHPNGTTSVYGHLSKLRDDIREYAINVQYQKESFRVDQAVPQNTFLIKKGELIAYSGNSGSSGGPHLHFEIRKTSDQHPLNPLNFKFPVSDQIKPKILSVMIYPLSDDAHVSGDQQAKKIETVFYDGSYHLKGNPTISVFGEIGFGLQALDYLDGSWSKCGIYEIKLSVDKKRIYTFLMNELSFDETRYINSHIDYGHYRKFWQKIHKSWIDPGNKLNNYHNVIDRGIIHLSDNQSHLVEYEIADVYGNTSTLSFQVRSKEIVNKTKKTKGFQVFYNKASELSTVDFSAAFTAGTFYSNQKLDYQSRSSNNLYFSAIHQLQNETIPVHKFYDLKIKPEGLSDNLKEKAIIVSIDNKSGKKYPLGGSYKDGWVKARIRTLGNFAVDVDTISPTINPLSIRNHSSLSEKEGIRFKISDDFSGIASYRGEIDGKWVLFEYDAKNKLLEYQFDQQRFQFNQNHQLQLKVTDAKGNETIYEAQFYK